MAIAINSNFHLGAALPLDDRGYLTKAEMLLVDENIYTDYFLVICADDGFLYMFDKNTDELDPETGKFKLFAGDVNEAIRILNSEEDVENSVRYWIKNNSANALYDTKEITTYNFSISDKDIELTSTQIDRVIEGENLKIAPGVFLVYNAENKQFSTVIEDIETPILLPSPNTVTINQTIKEKINKVEENSKIELDVAEITTKGYLKTYVITQGKEEIGKIDIPKDLVVQAGSIIKIDMVIDPADGDIVLGYKIDNSTEIIYTNDDVVNEKSEYFNYPTSTAKYIKLIIANQKMPIFIDIRDIMPEGAGETTEDIITNIELGGFSENETIPAGTDIQEFISQLMIKYFPPSIDLKSSVTTFVQRFGTTLENVILTATVAKKSLDITGVIINGESIEDVNKEDGIYTKTISTIDNSIVLNASVTDGTETSSTKIEFKFVYPYIYGTIDSVESIDLDNLTEIIEEEGPKSLLYTAANKYLIYAIPNSYADLTSILDLNGLENLTSWTKTVQTNAAGETYKVYYSNSPITCNSFKYTFK